jgi:pectate lyase
MKQNFRRQEINNVNSINILTNEKQIPYIMKKLILNTLVLWGLFFSASATDVSTLKWSQVCSGAMGTEWYSSAQAQAIADVLLEVQKTNGGWMKNYDYHKLSSSDLAGLKNSRHDHSCLDNGSTTMEMCFLAKVWQGCKVEKYREAFDKALNMIFEAEKSCGGWSQYWPLDNNGGYRDYITFNDDLITNIMELLRNIHANKGDFADIVGEAEREHCQTSFDKGIEVILNCQVDDNGKKAAWCAQHDPADLLPAVGRPHELPSISGSESATLLSFLMTIENPSPELQEAITAAVTWLDEHKIEGKAIEDYVNAAGEQDRRIVDKPGSAIWGRFIQLGGKTGKQVYNKLFNMLGERGKSRSYTYQGKTYTYTEEEIARTSYREDKAYQPIFAIYSDEVAHLYYRFLYNYDDTDPVVDSKGCPIATSLTASNRRSYQYLGSWCQRVIKDEYPAWKQKIDAGNEAGDATLHELSGITYTSSSADGLTYHFQDGFTISNAKGKQYANGQSNTLKFSQGVEYNISIPEDLKVVKVAFYGYDNYDVEAYLRKLNGVEYSPTDYVFPAKMNGEVTYVQHTIDLSDKPAQQNLDFSFEVKQCCVIITLYCVETKDPTGIREVSVEDSDVPVKQIRNGRIVIIKSGKIYNTIGQQIDN